MKFIVNAREFLDALAPALSVSSTNSLKDFDFAGKITIKALKDQIIATAFGGKASIYAPISDKNFGELEYENIEEGEVTVLSNELDGSLSSLPQEKVEFSLIKGELVITLCSDGDFKRAMPIFLENISLPAFAKDFDNEFTVNREEFVKSVEKVGFATAIEENMECYKCVYIEAFPNKIQLSAGSGARFAVNVREGSSVIKDIKQDKVQMYLHEQHLRNITKILTSLSDETVTIKHAKSDGGSNIPEQVVFEFNGMSLFLYGIEMFQKYPDMRKILLNDYPNKIYTNSSDWKIAVEGIAVTQKNYKDDIHNSEVHLDQENVRLIVESQTKHKARSPIPLAKDDQCKIVGDKVWFRCNSNYLMDVVSCSKGEEELMFNFESQSILEKVPDDKPLKMKPILVKYPDKDDSAKGVKESFYLFFGVSTKE